MKNGATIVLESAWALNTLDVDEAKTSLCGTLAGADMKAEHGEKGYTSLRINSVKHGRMIVEKPDLNVGGVAFYEGGSSTPEGKEAQQWIDAVRNDTIPTVLPEQAIVVTQILEAIYESSKTGKPVFFD